MLKKLLSYEPLVGFLAGLAIAVPLAGIAVYLLGWRFLTTTGGHQVLGPLPSLLMFALFAGAAVAIAIPVGARLQHSGHLQVKTRSRGR